LITERSVIYISGNSIAKEGVIIWLILLSCIPHFSHICMPCTQKGVVTCQYYVIPAAPVPGQVQNLRSTLDTDIPTLTLHWDKPKNMVTDGDVISYDIRFKPTGSGWEGNYCKHIVNPPATSILLTRESGLKPMTKYDFEIRVQSFCHEGKWTKDSKYISKFIIYFVHFHAAIVLVITRIHLKPLCY